MVSLVILRQRLQVLEGQATLLLVDFGHMLHRFDRFRIVALVYGVFWRFSKRKDEEAQEEYEERQASERVKQVSPSHVIRSRAARRPCFCRATGRERILFGEIGRTRVRRDEAESDGAANDDAEWLEHGQACQQEAAVLSGHQLTPTPAFRLRGRRTCGTNSRKIALSTGMFPPTPKPTKAVMTRKVV